ncbi:D-Ala-D-Ala carboxypeptidase VanY [Bacillaceae bacterium SAS-127]|nr:D-Ala-D-Ala carboxypeptidase VanY [Bacillaceae bacterium SAS-127]
MENSESSLGIKKITILMLIASLLMGSYLGVKGFFPAFHQVAGLENGWNLILVNQDIYIPDDYNIELTVLSNGERVDSRIYPDLQDMFDHARKDGVYPVVGAGFRTHKKQQTLFDQKIEAYRAEGYSKAESHKLAKEAVALPDTSEHQLGLAVDINADQSKSTNDEVYEWLAQNAYHYGFILRYPPDKTDITGTVYEPWHYRYVGKDAAREMYTQKVCLEEYIDGLD